MLDKFRSKTTSKPVHTGGKSLVTNKLVLNKRNGLIFIAMFAVVGASLLVISRAATSPVAFEPETGTLAAGATSVANANASGGRVVAFGGAATPAPTPNATAGVYGPGIGFDCKGNVVIYNQESMAMRFKAGTTSTVTGVQWTQRMGGTGYSAGNGGTTTVSVQADNGAGKPNGTKLATTTWAGGNNSAGEERYDISRFSSPPSLTAGKIYYIVFENPSASNYISVNAGYTYSGGAANAVRSVNPKQPRFADSDFGVLLTTAYGGAWSDTVSDAQGYTPVVDIIYANGHHDGQAYYENIGAGGYSATISGTANMARETFTVSGGTRSVNSAGIRVRRHSGTSPLVITLETSAGTFIDSATIPAASIQIPPNMAYSLSGGGGAVWASGNFAAARTLANGSSYNLRFSTAAGTTYSVDPLRNATEQYYQFHSYDFTDGIPYYTTNGSTWSKTARDWMVGENWDLQFYLK